MFVLFPQVSSDRIPQSAPMDDQEVAEPLVAGISSAFLERHSQDGGLLEWLHDQASVGASSRASVINLLSFNRAIPCMFYCNIINISRQRRSDSGFNR